MASDYNTVDVCRHKYFYLEGLCPRISQILLHIIYIIILKGNNWIKYNFSPDGKHFSHMQIYHFKLQSTQQ